MNTTALPDYIAICGNPNSGKSTAAQIIADLYGYVLADDGLALRRIAIDYMGLTPEQCFTQEGKLEYVELNGRRWQAREILGEIGNAFEDRFGGDIIPIMAHHAQPKGVRAVFGSVRREQALYWRKQGAIVLEIVNPLAGESAYAFDRYNAGHAHHQILNDAQARGLEDKTGKLDLMAKIVDVLGPAI